MKRLFYYALVSVVLCQYTVSSTNTHNAKRPIVAVTIPKCGTHLLAKCISLLTGKLPFPLHQFTKLEDSSFVIPPFMLVHAPYSKHKENNLLNQKSRVFFLYRDPRDQVVSLAFFIKYMHLDLMNIVHPQLNIALKLVDLDTLMLDLITNAPGVYTGQTIAQFYDQFLPWLRVRAVCPVKFENLIGVKGGGTQQAQIKEIKRISNWLDLGKSTQEIAHIAQMLFGKSTFREGKIGSWKKYFTPEHKSAFKQVAGQLLIDLGYEKDLNW